MRRWMLAVLVGGLALAGAAAIQVQAQSSDLVVHEWGTFLAMQGSDGVTLDGMYHEEHSLPEFVHARSKDQLRLPSMLLKGETPVIYFYTPRRQRVRVEVKFPSGFWTQWYPQASLVAPAMSSTGSPSAPKNGRIIWNADVVPFGSGIKPPALPSTSADALWNYSREVDSAYVRTTNRGDEAASEWERFIFYRGLGQAALPLTYEGSTRSGGTLTGKETRLSHLFLIRVEGKRAAFRYVPELGPSQTIPAAMPADKDLQPLDQAADQLDAALTQRLTQSGLYPKEATAMVRTWRESYFKTPGSRVLFVMPQSWTDAFIPMNLRPQPKQTVRVMVGRLELLTPERELAVENAVRGLSSKEAAVRELSFKQIQSQGRFAEPVLRRLSRSGAEDVRSRAQELLATEYITALRASINVASSGKRRDEDPLYLRAQLALLLREVGMADEARQEGETVLADSRLQGRPNFDNDESRHPLRARARAADATGNAKRAVDAYSELIRFGAQVQTKNGCTGCHRSSGDGPDKMAWFRDWWAGRRYALAIKQSGQMDQVIAGLQGQENAASRMMLAYLRQSQGRSDTALALWQELERPSRSVRAR
jgi:hypothetical protein